MDEGQQSHAALVSDLNAASMRCLAVQNELADLQADFLGTLDREIELRTRLNATEGREVELQTRMNAAEGRETELQTRLNAAEGHETELQSRLNAALDREVASETTTRELERRVRSTMVTLGGLQVSIAEAEHLAWIKEGEGRERELRHSVQLGAATRDAAASQAQLVEQARAYEAVAADLRAELEAAVAQRDAEVRDLAGKLDAATRDAAASQAQLVEQARAYEAVAADLRAELEAAVAQRDAEVRDLAGKLDAERVDLAAATGQAVAEQQAHFRAFRNKAAAQINKVSMLLRHRVQSLSEQVALLDEPGQSASRERDSIE